MNTPAYVHDLIIPAALAMLPTKMSSAPARALMMAIGLQESGFVYRTQVDGPARGFWQFEMAGVKGVLGHDASRGQIATILGTLAYDGRIATSYEAIAHNDILACVYARLLLWTLPEPLPARDNPDEAWNQYVSAWRPGKPRRESWDEFYSEAWTIVEPSNAVV